MLLCPCEGAPPGLVWLAPPSRDDQQRRDNAIAEAMAWAGRTPPFRPQRASGRRLRRRSLSQEERRDSLGSACLGARVSVQVEGLDAESEPVPRRSPLQTSTGQGRARSISRLM